MLKEACDKWKIPYLDFFEGSTEIEGEQKSYRDIFQVTEQVYFLDDYVHPTELGYQKIVPFIRRWMQSLSNYSIS